MMAASLLEPLPSSRRVLSALRHSNSPRPSVAEAKAAKYLQSSFLPYHGGSVRAAVVTPVDVISAGWLGAHSKLISEITDEDLIQLRIDLGGNTCQTRRTYWAGIEAVLHWGVATGRLDRDPSIGLPKLKRIVSVEQPVGDRIPEEAEIWEIAAVGRSMIGESFAVAVLLGGYGALRVGELVALRPECLARAESGGLWLTVSTQRRRFPKRHSNDGASTGDFAPPKGCIAGPNARRRCYIPAHVAEEIAGYLESRSGEEFLFTTDRGRPCTTEAFRGRWNRVIAALPPSHRLAGITPHSLRHAGMLMWLRKGVDLKLIQAWGGWNSLKVMLDTYAALLPGAEEYSIALIEGLSLVFCL